MGPRAAPGLESEYKRRLHASRPSGASCSLLIKRSGVRIPLRALPVFEYESWPIVTDRRVGLHE